MIERLGIVSGRQLLDVAGGTGSITRELRRRGAAVVSLDQSREMLARASARGAVAVVASGERLPFPDASFDGVTAGYLLRYVEHVPLALVELSRVLRSGGVVGLVEFGRPGGGWRQPWRFYTRVVLPLAGAMLGAAWRQVTNFLGPSIERFADIWPSSRLASAFTQAGFVEVELTTMSLGGGLVITARKP